MKKLTQQAIPMMKEAIVPALRCQMAAPVLLAYDTEDRLVLTTDAQGGSRTYIYYKNEKYKGLLHTITEADGRITIFRYNEHNLLSKVEDEREHRTILNMMLTITYLH